MRSSISSFFSKKKILFKILFFLPALIFSIFWVISLIYAFNISLFIYSPLKMFIPKYTIENYINFFTNSFFVKRIFSTIYLSMIVTVLTLIVAYPVGYYLARVSSPVIRTIILAILLCPFFVVMVVRVYGWIAILSDNGIINNILMWLHFIDKPLRILYNLPAVIIGLIEVNLSIMVFSIYTSIVGIDTSFEEAAITSGASSFRTFYHITLPLSIPGIYSGTSIIFGTNLGAFLHPIFLGGGYVQTLGLLAYKRFELTLNWPMGAAISFIMLFMILSLLYVYSKIIRYFKIMRR